MALSRRGVAHLNFPIDFQSMPVKKGHHSERGRAHKNGNAQTFARRAALPNEEDVRRAAAAFPC